ncbi:MAG: heavy-metal-associated domain-containing protein [Peptostreptococcaceae bacterium]|nr:heavy-metal-associated domain-containing protein [Peptostreptococcaceae bacterium]
MNKKIMIKGMMCEHCQKRVKNALLKIDGVENVVVDIEEGSAKLRMLREVGDSEFRFAIEDAGYEVVSME